MHPMAYRPAKILDALTPLILSLRANLRLSDRAIAKLLQISRASVHKIISGERGDEAWRDERRRDRDTEPRLLKYCAICQRCTPSPCVVCAARAWRRWRGLGL